MEAIPRVNFDLMQRYQGRTVSLIGKVDVQPDGNYVLRTSDESDVTVKANRGPSSSAITTAYVEIVGRVTGPREIQEEFHIDLRGQSIDMKVYNEMVKLANGKYMSKFLA